MLSVGRRYGRRTDPITAGATFKAVPMCGGKIGDLSPSVDGSPSSSSLEKLENTSSSSDKDFAGYILRQELNKSTGINEHQEN